MKLSVIVFLFLVIFRPAHSLETDNYLVWDRELKDSTEEINQLFKQQIQSVLNSVNQNPFPVSCRAVTFQIADRFKTYPPLKIFIEDWLIANLSSEQIYPLNMNYIAESIYKNTYGVFFKKIPLSPNIQVNGIYFGTDKLSHFSSTSRSYLKKYLKQRDQGVGEEEAMKSAINLGILKETTILGLKAIGVYSYGDLEANFQGFLFYKNMCLNQEGTYLNQDSTGKWVLVRAPNIRDYATPYWDETFNHSYRSEKNWMKTSRMIKKKYCHLASSALVQERMSYYKRVLRPSFSVGYLEELRALESRKTPRPQSREILDPLCDSSVN